MDDRVPVLVKVVAVERGGGGHGGSLSPVSAAQKDALRNNGGLAGAVVDGDERQRPQSPRRVHGARITLFKPGAQKAPGPCLVTASAGSEPKPPTRVYSLAEQMGQQLTQQAAKRTFRFNV